MSLNLRSRDAWTVATSPKTGEKLPDVIESTSKDFTICKSLVGKRERFLAWRRRPKPEMADLVGVYDNPDQARDACERYAAKEGA